MISRYKSTGAKLCNFGVRYQASSVVVGFNLLLTIKYNTKMRLKCRIDVSHIEILTTGLFLTTKHRYSYVTMLVGLNNRQIVFNLLGLYTVFSFNSLIS